MQKLELFSNLVNLAASDRKFTEEEIKFLVDRAEQWGIHNDEFETAMAGITTGALTINIPEDHGQRVLLLKEMLRLMAVDGHLAEMEKKLCAKASGKMDFTTQQFNEILDDVIGEAN